MSCPQVAGQSAPASAPADSLADLLAPIQKKHKIPALAAAVVQGGRTVDVAAVGRRKIRSKDPVVLDDPFCIGSCTKSMTATLCAMLVEQGKLRWDMTVTEAFGEQAGGLHPKFADVTLDQLLCHRSGLAEDRRPDPATWPKVLMLKGELPAQRRELVEIVLSRKPAHEPGSKFAYSNYGFVIAGAMCEAVTGEPYESLMRRMLFEPLGMKTAGFGPPGADSADKAPWGHNAMLGPYSAVSPKGIAGNPRVIGPAGLVHCSLGDWARYAALHLDAARGAPRLLKAGTFEKLHTDAYRQDYTFGWAIRREEWAGGTTLAHSGSDGLWFATIVIAPDRNAAFMVATNAADGKAQKACRDAIRAMRQHYLGEAETPKDRG